MNFTQRIKNFKGKVVILALVGLVAFMWFRPLAFVSEMNEPLPNLPFTTLDGRMGTLEGLRGKVVLVNFWATWCPYCRHEMPAMQDFYNDYQGKGFEILAFSVDDDPAKVESFLREKGYTFPALVASADQRRAFGDVSRLPTSFIIDKNGRLRHKISGQVHYGRLKNLVEPLLNPTPGDRK
jgi:thiol-disulfide isomerase/thioredoxin